MNRNHQIDSLKFYLICLVIFGHFIESALHNNIIDYIYRFIYIFHMPAFIFLSGMLSSKNLTEDKLNSLITSVILPLIFYQFISQLISAKLNINNINYNLITPAWGLWYLMSLISWRILLPFFLQFKKPLLVVCFISITIGTAPYINDQWSLSRTFVFFPFFVLGYLWKDRSNSQLTTPTINIPTMVLGWLLVCALAFYSLRFNHSWLYMNTGYLNFNLSNIEGMYLRTIHLAISFVGILCLFTAVEKFSNYKFVSSLGQYSMAAYIIHLYALTILNHFGLSKFLSTLSTHQILIVSIASTITMSIVFSLCGKKFPWLFNFKWLNINKTILHNN